MKKMHVLEDLKIMSSKIEDLNKEISCLRNKENPESLNVVLKEMKNIHLLLDDLESSYMIRYGLAKLKKHQL
ncbi:MAG: hypothetical protein ISQ32_03745 [Rickettsiales bacterium]|nr:hypothetical protein [Rickettsiales bacterium]